MTDQVLSDYRDTWLFQAVPFELHRTERGHLVIEFNPHRPEPEHEDDVVHALAKMIAMLLLAGILFALRWLT